jgi:hypothetical protein
VAGPGRAFDVLHRRRAPSSPIAFHSPTLRAPEEVPTRCQIPLRLRRGSVYLRPASHCCGYVAA